MSKLSKLKFVKWTDKEIKEGTHKLNKGSKKNIKDLYRWFKDAGRPLKK